MGEREHRIPDFLWRRWDSEDLVGKYEAETLSNRRFFEFCAVLFAGDACSEQERDPKKYQKDGIDVEPVSFLPTVVRLLLRHVPSMVFVFLVLALAEAELRSDIRGVSVLFPEIPLVPLVFLALAVGALLYVFVKSKLTDRKTVLKATFVYGLAGILLAGSIFGTFLTLETRGETTITPHVVYTFPTLLFTLLIGLLAYDLLLRGEFLYTHLGKKNIVMKCTGYERNGNETEQSWSENDENGRTCKERYEDIKTRELLPKLRGGPISSLRYGHLFAFFILILYLLIWSFKGPLGTGLWSSFLLNLTINLVVLVGVFNFLVGVIFLRNLLKGEYSEDGKVFQPRYLPFHPDRQGGFADIGEMAMRINVIFILIGIYYVYRAYISGLRAFPLQSELPFAPLYAELIGIEQTLVLEMAFWVVNFLGPIFLYAVVVVVWFYYTFWEIHKIMSKQKKDLILEKQLESRKDYNDDRLALYNAPEWPVNREVREDSEPDGRWETPLGDYEDKEDWMALNDAPEWPINTQKLGGLVTGNVIPLLLSIPTVLTDLLTAWA